MKNAKKVFAMLIVLALAISMAIPVSAEVGTGSIKIDKAIKGQTYSVYQMAVLDYVNKTPNTEGPEDLYAYYVIDGGKDVEDWYDFFARQSTIFTLTASATDPDKYAISVSAGSLSDAAKEKLAKDALAFAKTNKIKAKKTAEANDTTLNITGLQFGYYVVDTTTGSLCTLDSVNGDVKIYDKNEEPNVEKFITKVSEDEGVERDFNDVKAADVNIGDIVSYKIEVTVKKGAHNYVVTDILSKGLTLLNKDNKPATSSNFDAITIDGATLGEDSKFETDIIIDEKQTENDKITIVIDGEETLAEDTVITITYKAMVNTDAVIDNPNPNEVTLSYGDSPNVSDDIVNVYPLSFGILKTDGTNPLPGAEFKIYKKINNVKYYLELEGGNGQYVYSGITTVEEEGTKIVANSDPNKVGEYNIDGLDADTYYLKEVTVPTGYNALSSDPKIDVIATTSGNTIDLSYDENNASGIIEVVNSSGALLPETGATGTIIFITVGGLMVVAMGVLLVVRKRMSKVVYTR